MRLSFVHTRQKILINCLYAPNKDSVKGDEENESTAFYRKAFDDDNDMDFQHCIMTGDLNVALDHEEDTYMLMTQLQDNILKPGWPQTISLILMEVRAYAMKFAANKKREEQRIKKVLEEKIDRIQNSLESDDLEELDTLKRCIDDIENKEDEIAVRKSMVKYNLEGEKPTYFFCKLNRKLKKVLYSLIPSWLKKRI